MHLSSIFVGVVGLASISFAAATPMPTPEPEPASPTRGCTYTQYSTIPLGLDNKAVSYIYKFANGQKGPESTKTQLIDCKGCTAVLTTYLYRMRNGVLTSYT
ncbi:hypothetical protein TWF718_007290 [Orbilia javanica]|uniref:Uncharacterized protein n=1 Tax=Orbilia javanica TaxID=47235 RepID=A0AAN8RNG8_9PEZI